MNNIDKQLEERRKKVGSKTQNASIEQFEKQKHSPIKEYEETTTGKRVRFKKIVGDILQKRGEIQPTKLVFSVPDLSHIDWSK